MLSGSFYFWHPRCAVSVRRTRFPRLAKWMSSVAGAIRKERPFLDPHRIGKHDANTEAWRSTRMVIIQLVTAKFLETSLYFVYGLMTSFTTYVLLNNGGRS